MKKLASLLTDYRFTDLCPRMATQRHTVRHAENIEDKKASFICMIATPVTPVLCTM